MNPYANLPDHHFWRRSVSNVDRQDFDPVTATRFTIDRNARIATAGSCFAQHISRKLDEAGFNYLVTESGADLPAAERAAGQYGVFSARYGNIYTTRQLRQVFDAAFGHWTPAEPAWVRPDGRFVDPFRPQVEPEGFDSPAAVAAAREAHLRCVRAMFEQADVFVFTLGLTEAWFSKVDGAVFPLAPGVVAGPFDGERHGFVNFGVAEVEADLRHVLAGLKAVNPGVKVLLTVSPVPLIATYEDRNVLVATTYSKSVLRVAAEAVMRDTPWVDYFPSYEIVTGSFNFGAYYGEDAREVNAMGVAHAMRAFLHNYVPDRAPSRPAVPPVAQPARHSPAGVICDEEAIAQITF